MLQLYVLYEMIFKTDGTSKAARAYLFYTSKLRLSIIQMLRASVNDENRTTYFAFSIRRNNRSRQGKLDVS